MKLYDLVDDPHETRNLIGELQQRRRVQRMRAALHERFRLTGGLTIPLGFKRGPGANLRNPTGSKRSPFPPSMIDEHK